MTAQPTDYDALAKRYLDLWQQEMAKLAQDPQAAGAWANLFQGMMQNATAAWGQACAPGASPTTSGFNFGGLNHERAAPAKSPVDATRAAPPPSADNLDTLKSQLDAMQARLDKLAKDRS